MNNWIDKHIIFPKINEGDLKQQRKKQADHISKAIIDQLRRKNNSSLYNMKGAQNSKSNNLSSQKGRVKPSSIKKDQTKFSSYFQMSIKEIESPNCKTVKYVNIRQLLQERKCLFNSGPLKSTLQKLKVKNFDVSDALKQTEQTKTQKKIKRRYLKAKLTKCKTQGKDQIVFTRQIQETPYEKEFIRIKKAVKFDYHNIIKPIQIDRQIKVRNFLKKKQFEALDEAQLKITSIKGWSNQYNQCNQQL